MSVIIASDQKPLFQELEPILVSLYKSDNGKSPTLYELKQYLVSYASENLVDALINSDSSIFKAMSANEALTTINLYIRKLRVW
jgi:hypothetical protein